jgi:ubiquitin carboxyl-terminal hydrolase 14
MEKDMRERELEETKEESKEPLAPARDSELGAGLPTGNYELKAIVTHQGRSADSGHYVGWV